MINVVDFAYEIIEMDRIIKSQQKEIDRLSEYETKYRELMDSSIKHGEKMMANMLSVLLVPGVSKAFTEQAELAKGVNET